MQDETPEEGSIFQEMINLGHRIGPKLFTFLLFSGILHTYY